MINLLVCDKSGQIRESQELSKVKEALDNPDVNFWVDIEDPNDDEIDLLIETFKFHPLAVEDVILDISVPKLDIYDGYAFLNLHRVFYSFEKETCDRRDFEVFFSTRYIVTIHEKNLNRTFQRTREKIIENPRKTLALEPSYVLLKLLELAARDYQPVMEEWQDTLDHIEQQVLANKKDHILEQILQFKKLVATMRKSLLPEREVVRMLYENSSLPFISARARPYFKSAVNDFNELLQDLESLRDHAGSVFDIYAAMLTIQMTESSNKLNFVMQRLTIAATIFLPLTFIVGVYGMNFEYMPEFHWPGFYYLLWGFMIALSASMIIFFKKKKWL